MERRGGHHGIKGCRFQIRRPTGIAQIPVDPPHPRIPRKGPAGDPQQDGIDIHSHHLQLRNPIQQARGHRSAAAGEIQDPSLPTDHRFHASDEGFQTLLPVGQISLLLPIPSPLPTFPIHRFGLLTFRLDPAHLQLTAGTSIFETNHINGFYRFF
jgi:hypothetical protein